MQKFKKLLVLLFCTSIFLFPFISKATCITTQGDTTFGVDEGDVLIWTSTGGAPEYRGHQYNLTIEDIYNGSYMTINSYIIDATLGYYNKTQGFWTTYIDDAFFIAANETQNFIEFESFAGDAGLYFIIPTPINLTMLGEFALNTGYYANYSISGDTITIEHAFIGTLHTTYNSDGITTKMVVEMFGITMVVMTLGTGGGGEIPFGFFFLIFTIIAILGLVHVKMKNIK
jgi:hypothetical protein